MKDLSAWNMPPRKPVLNRHPPRTSTRITRISKKPPKQPQHPGTQTDSDKTHETAMSNQNGTSKTRKKVMVSHPLQGVRGKDLNLTERRRRPAHPADELSPPSSYTLGWALSSFLVHPIRKEVQNPKNEPHPLKIGQFRTRSLAPLGAWSSLPPWRRHPVTAPNVS